ncbi:uncharacterized protein BO88DRAFT_406513 [Aspergillus vadensis CBS 113365]|uniref:Uncharacterized protein n=1 Tax=Aspergillus vadensis (strain CBS 113365 / IMI 142717 / IBT 24658) TaxID=1448311 RepID=A0A319B4P4_ASPVC|nr:hypothetical protein BO88DRAFT_406513 [Aspergillus vadensis CBS 113365]PYH66841.1 hypothetical protein BO88DRAFT_406513 [Aspergillus vadensis CBS 113365]
MNRKKTRPRPGRPQISRLFPFRRLSLPPFSLASSSAPSESHLRPAQHQTSSSLRLLKRGVCCLIQAVAPLIKTPSSSPEPVGRIPHQPHVHSPLGCPKPTG